MSTVAPQLSLSAPPPSGDCRTLPGAPPRPDPTANNSHSSVPPLEPPAPIAARARSRVASWRWWLDRGRELPSWMSSMVLHLAFTIVFASLAVKSGPQPNAVLVLELSATMADVPEDDPSSIEFTQLEHTPVPESEVDFKETFVRLEQTLPMPVESPTAETGLSETQDAKPGTDEIAVLPQPQASPSDGLDPFGDANGDESFAEAGAPVGAVVDPLGNVADAGGNVADAGAAAADAGLQESVSMQQRAKPLVKPPAQPEEADADEIVENFIQYDIGKLTGAAGNRAQKAFQRLGADDIPALVRGLNQSASIRASCPVVVISTKLQNTLKQTNDQATIDYVLENLGRDVPRNAPHAKRIDALRAKLATSAADRQFNQDLARVRPIQNESPSRWVPRVRRLYRAGGKEIAAALERPDEQRAAWAALAMRARPELTHAERMQLAEILLDQWQWRYQSNSNRARIHDALTTLAQGSRVSENLPNIRGQPDYVRRQWQEWWGKYDKTDPEAQSAELVRLARFANDRTAQRLLARAVEQFPTTQNAEVARHMLVPASRVALAQSLEKQRRWAEAYRLYEELATEFPDSPQAVTAGQRLNVLARFREPERTASE